MDAWGAIALEVRLTEMSVKIRISELNNRGDARGFSLTAPVEALEYVGRMADVHLASTKPAAAIIVT
jgi:hypothetical protein